MIVCDAAHLPFRTQSIDLTLTSPPSQMDPVQRCAALLEIGRVTRGRIIVLANTPGQHAEVGYPYPTFADGYVRALIGLNSEPGDRVLDCFCGSDVTGRVAAKMGRVPVSADLYAREHG